MRVCKVDGCNKRHYANGFCSYHNLINKSKENKELGRICELEGCNHGISYANNNFCYIHYYLHIEQKNKKNNKACKHEGCNRGISSGLYCRTHNEKTKRWEKENISMIECEFPNCKEMLYSSHRIHTPYCKEHTAQTKRNIYLGINIYSQLPDLKEIKLVRKVVGPKLKEFSDKDILKLIDNIKDLIEELPDERFQCVLSEYYFGGCTLDKTGEKIKRLDSHDNPLSRERVRQIINMAVRTLRNSKRKNKLLNDLSL